MTKQEAMQALREGKRVTHEYFTDDEYLTMEKGFFSDENGYHLEWGDFWQHRNSESFNTGWSIFK